MNCYESSANCKGFLSACHSLPFLAVPRHSSIKKPGARAARLSKSQRRIKRSRVGRKKTFRARLTGKGRGEGSSRHENFFELNHKKSSFKSKTYPIFIRFSKVSVRLSSTVLKGTNTGFQRRIWQSWYTRVIPPRERRDCEVDYQVRDLH